MAVREPLLAAMAARGWEPAPGNLSTFLYKDRVTLFLTFNSFRAKLELLSVPVSRRRQGLGRAALRDLCSAADEAGATLALEVHPIGDGGPDTQGLITLYEEAGFSKGGLSADAKPLMHRRAPAPRPKECETPEVAY